MISDTAPDVLFMSYGRPRRLEQLRYAIELMGLRQRKIEFFTVQFPLNKHYDEIVNWFKHFIHYEYWKLRSPVNILNKLPFAKTISKKLPFTPMDITKEPWECDTRHKLIMSLCVPIGYQEAGKENCTTKLEEENMQKLKTFSSTGYKANTTEVMSDPAYVNKKITKSKKKKII